MLSQWRYKVCKEFGRLDDSIIIGDRLHKISHSKPYPDRFFLYRVSKRKYDYVDYTGKCKFGEVEHNEITNWLEFYGYIKFVDKVKCDG